MSIYQNSGQNPSDSLAFSLRSLSSHRYGVRSSHYKVKSVFMEREKFSRVFRKDRSNSGTGHTFILGNCNGEDEDYENS